MIDPRTNAFVRQLRLATGLVLFVFLTLHLANHALGLHSLAAMREGAIWFKALWRNPLLWALLPAAAILHPLLALWSFLARGTWRGIRFAEILQLVLGLSLPSLLVLHIVATRGLATAFGMNDTYDNVLAAIWVNNPQRGLLQALALIMAWTHGCIGMERWLRGKSIYGKARPYLFAAALLLPTLALGGFNQAGREVALRMAEPGGAAAISAETGLPAYGNTAAWVNAQVDRIEGMILAAIAGLVLLRLLQYALDRRKGVVTLRYASGAKVRVPSGSLTILEASRRAGIPHASVCGGRGRCSTCRVALAGEGIASLPPPNDAERRVLQRINAPENVRLACQVRASCNLDVTPLLAPDRATGRAASVHQQGAERTIAILFADLRGFTQLTERRLPYDVVFLLNQYFRVMGEAIESAGGHVDKFIGDGIMALFGINDGPEAGSRAALDAARRMGRALEALNRSLAGADHHGEATSPLRMGIGIHCGTVIVGEMGHGRAVSLTAIGDAVNTASRLESATKEFGVELAFSAEVAARAGVDASSLDHRRIEVRGRSAPLDVVVMARATDAP